MGIFSEMDTSCRDQTDNTELWSFSNNFLRFPACVEYMLMNSEVQYFMLNHLSSVCIKVEEK